MQQQSLSLSQVQQLQMVLAPQLRQSLEMLQAPILELRTMIQKELEQNPTIEEAPSKTETVEIEPGTGKQEDQNEMDFDKEFEVLVFGNQKVSCPHCNGKKVRKLLSAVSHKSEGGFSSSQGSACGSCTSSSCSTCGG